MNEGFTQLRSLAVFLPILSLAISLISIVAVLNVFWRVKHRLRYFAGFMMGAIIVTALRKTLGLLGFTNAESWASSLMVFDIAASSLFMIASIEFYRIIRVLDNENPKPRE
jgi:hypothetical protein